MPVQTIWRNVSSQTFFTKVIGLLWFLLIAAMATGLRNEFAKNLGSLALSLVSALTPVLALFVLKNDQNRQALKGFLIAVGALLILYLVPHGDIDSYPVSLRRALQIIVVASVYIVFFYFAALTGNWPTIARWSRISLILPAVLLCYVLLNESLSLRGWNLGFQNPNVAGMALFSLWPSLILIKENPKWWQISITSLIVLFFIFATSSRASVVGLIIAGSLFWVSGRAVFTHIRWGLLTIVLAMPILIVATATSGSWQGSSDLDRWFITYMDKSLFSGRNELWSQALSEVKTSFFLGLGGGAQMQAANGLTLSIHNLFLQTLHQVGIVGLSTLIWILYSVCPKPSLRDPKYFSRVAIAFWSGILVIQVFEVTLTQNNLTLGLPFWAVMGFAAGMTGSSGQTANRA